MPNPPVRKVAEGLLKLFQLTETEPDVWSSPPTPDEHRVSTGRIFGGQVVGQALMAAEASVEGRPAGSFHCRFLRPGNVDKPIRFRVERDLDGRSFAHRRVVADQGGAPILTCSMMFHTREAGIMHQPPMPEVIGPEEAVRALMAVRDAAGPFASMAAAFVDDTRSVDMAPVNLPQWDTREPDEAPVVAWFRFGTAAPDDPRVHRAILGYASDMLLLRASDVRHGLSWMRGEVVQASLDHMIWFHDDFRADEWLLYVTESPWGGYGRVLTRGQIFSRDGRLVATTTQEGSHRMAPRPAS